MKKIVASVGLVAIGASGIQLASAQSVPDNSKPWSISATLRGFYDDNVSTVPNNATLPAGYHRDTLGYEVSPSAALSWSVEQTTLNLGVLYAFKYYENKPIGSTGHSDNVVTVTAGLTHAFSEQSKLRVNDSFVLGQEPDLLRANDSMSTFQRASGDNIRNYGSIGYEQQFSPTVGMDIGYDNAFYDYKNTGGTPTNPSLAGTLNRIEHRAHIEGTYAMQPETKALVGYRFSEFNYTGDEVIGLGGAMSGDRNERSHTPYLGLEHNFTPQLSAGLRVGATYADFYNANNTAWSPYVNGNLTYKYAPESSASLGISYDRNASDVVGSTFFGGITHGILDAESVVVFASVSHRLASQVFANVVGQFQNSILHGNDASASYNNKAEQYYLAGLDLEYRFNQYLSCHLGYNYDRLESDLGRTFDRNRVYLGVTASY